MPLLILLLVLVGLGLLGLSRRRQSQAGLPVGRVVSIDTSDLDRPERPLYDPRLGLVGRPDYLVRGRRAIVPVEVKAAKAPREPWSSHVFQLAAYCLLVESSYKQRPPYGILRYADRAFAIDYTRGLENELLDLLTPDVWECHGCRSEKRSYFCKNECKMVDCAKDKGIDFCVECDEYPCHELRTFKELRPHRIELWENQKRIKEVGYAQWYEEMLEHYACPQCRTLNSAYDLKCRSCGAEPSCAYVDRHKNEILFYSSKKK